jgi:hypothetical protein
MKARSRAAISSRIANSARPHHTDGSGAATWPKKTISSKISAVGPDPCTYGSDLRVRSRTSTSVPGPLGRVPDPLCRVRTTHSKVPGYRDREYPGFDQGQEWVRSRHVSRPYYVRFRSPLRRRPDAAAWPVARDVSQRADTDVRLLGHASSAFIADKTRRLTGDVPPRHLMCPVHSVDR